MRGISMYISIIVFGGASEKWEWKMTMEVKGIYV